MYVLLGLGHPIPVGRLRPMEAERGHGGAQDPIVSQQKFPETPPAPAFGPSHNLSVVT